MLLMATLVNNPGIGYFEEESSKETKNFHNSLSLLQEEILIIAQDIHINIEKPAISTLRKDLETLRNFLV